MDTLPYTRLLRYCVIIISKQGLLALIKENYCRFIKFQHKDGIQHYDGFHCL